MDPDTDAHDHGQHNGECCHMCSVLAVSAIVFVLYLIVRQFRGPTRHNISDFPKKTLENVDVSRIVFSTVQSYLCN